MCYNFFKRELSMNKILSIVFFLVVCSVNCVFAETDFTRALRNCEKYSQTGTIPYEGQNFDLLITLQKQKDVCLYREKIIQDNKWQLLACKFSENQIPFIADSMDKYSKVYRKELDRNKIFEAKLTTNYEVFQKYLSDPHTCEITYSKNAKKAK